ncbi:MAG: hypothetical protein DRP35_05900 [Candidatus Zixiibacteriota bacterium]|nr:MAG: hypothetical protein DRP35_05900 [candidate division Zixibacteria bacterium]
MGLGHIYLFPLSSFNKSVLFRKASIFSFEISQDKFGYNLAVFHRRNCQANPTHSLFVTIVEYILKPDGGINRSA